MKVNHSIDAGYCCRLHINAHLLVDVIRGKPKTIAYASELMIYSSHSTVDYITLLEICQP